MKNVCIPDKGSENKFNIFSKGRTVFVASKMRYFTTTSGKVVITVELTENIARPTLKGVLIALLIALLGSNLVLLVSNRYIKESFCVLAIPYNVQKRMAKLHAIRQARCLATLVVGGDSMVADGYCCTLEVPHVTTFI